MIFRKRSARLISSCNFYNLELYILEATEMLRSVFFRPLYSADLMKEFQEIIGHVIDN